MEREQLFKNTNENSYNNIVESGNTKTRNENSKE